MTELDVTPSNIMLDIDDQSILSDFEKAEAEDPSPRKIIDDIRTIYGSRKLGLSKDKLWGQPVLCDFGEARIGTSHRGLIQPELLRAPEILFDMEWSSSVDIWNVGVLVSIIFSTFASAYYCTSLLFANHRSLI
jgi:serine/threonine protein kinase